MAIRAPDGANKNRISLKNLFGRGAGFENVLKMRSEK